MLYLTKEMKKIIVLLLTFPIVLCCSDSNFNNNNPYLPNYSFAVDINTNFPQFSDLKIPINSVYTPESGIRGLIVFNTGSGYTAFDAACPNQSLSSCSTMTIKGGTIAVCPCDSAEYSLFSGQCIGTKCEGKQYAMKQYLVEVNGNNLRVYN
jgi:nitrite reductase/ring-hydroxylating ferredoxin subunit